MQRKCHRCGKLFTPGSADKICNQCIYEIQHGQLMCDKHTDRKVITNYEKKEEKLTKKYKKICVICCNEFSTNRKDKKTCGVACAHEYNKKISEKYIIRKGLIDKWQSYQKRKKDD
ncbi:hypothetical protein [Veillonella montpellierensis]|uniref:hypothetical protein n=1 Tax=Veillonella montpellierensis TaxID=187328 RepID=UPI0004886226|nr:hypothetical protein [Veillonella montpellierensis]